MSIIYNNDLKIFHLQTPATSYIFTIEFGKIPIHLYYGKRVNNIENIGDLTAILPNGYMTNDFEEHPDFTSEIMPQEISFLGVDTRTPSFHANYADGSYITEAYYSSHSIEAGKKPIKGLPSTYVESAQEADTLRLNLKDDLTGLEICLVYTVYNTCDVITRHTEVTNNGITGINLKSVMSMNLDITDAKNYDIIHLYGAWARERHIQRSQLINGYQGIDSKKGSSSHYHSPFIALAKKHTTENAGLCYGFSLLYSGNFQAGVEVDYQDQARVIMGINSHNFNWVIKPGESFEAPEVVMTCSTDGIGAMSRTLHKLFRTRLCRGKYRDSNRPILINNWEATYFNFNEEKILSIAKKAKEIGIELMVLDDGWFGHRNDDHTSLGDWYTDTSKLPGGIESLAKKVTELGMKFGLWFEPEMVSPDSDLYRAHPDWCLHAKGRTRTLGRHQLTLDLSRDDVCEYIIEAMSKILSNAPVSYVKWDMNRNMSAIGSALLPPENQAEVAHRYMLGLYRVLETMVNRFPDVLFEGCAGGGGRFDAGMLHYFNQYWTSDNSDAIERLYIQYGTSLALPAVAMGAHVSAVPNHQVDRTTPLKTRGDVAMMGQFGYELDITSMTEEELGEMRNQISDCKALREIVARGDMYRLKSPFDGNNLAIEFVSEGKDEVAVFYCTILAVPASGYTKVYLEGLNPDAMYEDTKTGKKYSGDCLMNIGLNFTDRKDFTSRVIIFKKQ